MENWTRRTLTLITAAHFCVLKGILPTALHFGISIRSKEHSFKMWNWYWGTDCDKGGSFQILFCFFIVELNYHAMEDNITNKNY